MSYLRAFGSWLPSRRVTNEELAPLLGVSPEWILKYSGIHERRYVADDETIAVLAHRAALNCLEKAGLGAADLGLILVASCSTERFCPGPASQVASLLGLASTPALDIPVASAGSLIGLILASQLAASAKHVLVCGAEIMSRRISLTPEAKETAILFGDGAGACLVDRETGFARIADVALYTDGEQAELITITDKLFRMDGRSVLLQAARRIPRAISDLLERNGVAVTDVTAFLMHQANLNLITHVAKTLNAPMDSFFTNIAHCGNTSSASMLIAADEWWSSVDEKHIGPIVLAAFGSGLNWGCVLASND